MARMGETAFSASRVAASQAVEAATETRRAGKQRDIRLTDFDKRMLYMIDWEARASLTDIAKRMKTSPQVVKYRLERLLSGGVVSRFLTVAEYRKLGYTNHLVYMRLRAITPTKERQMIDFLVKRPDVNIVLKCDGGWDLGVGILAQDPFELNSAIDEIHKAYGRFIDEETIVTHIGAENYRRDYLVGNEERIPMTTMPSTGQRTAQVRLGGNELKVLTAINMDARLSLVEISERTGLTPDKVRTALRRLAKERLIVGYMFLPDYQRYPFLFYRILLSLKYMPPKRWDELLSFTRQHPNAFRTIKTFGGYSALVDAEFSSQAEFRAFMYDLKERFSDVILMADALLVSDVPKFSYFNPTYSVKKR